MLPETITSGKHEFIIGAQVRAPTQWGWECGEKRFYGGESFHLELPGSKLRCKKSHLTWDVLASSGSLNAREGKEDSEQPEERARK